MNRDLPKPFIVIAGKTILEHTLKQFVHLEGLAEVIIVVSDQYTEDARNILEEAVPTGIDSKCVIGGDERQDSVYNALRESAENHLVIVHDAVRPFVEPGNIEQCCRVATNTGAAVLGVPVKDTIKKVDGSHNIIVDTPGRQTLWQAQTPQVFRKSLLMKAYEKALEDQYQGTDDASLVERMGVEIRVVVGERSNFKITYPLDLELATLLLEQNR